MWLRVLWKGRQKLLQLPLERSSARPLQLYTLKSRLERAIIYHDSNDLQVGGVMCSRDFSTFEKREEIRQKTSKILMSIEDCSYFLTINFIYNDDYVNFFFQYIQPMKYIDN
jgi:hypothetical protein